MPGTLSVVIRIVYSCVLLFHIPYFVFTSKEYILVLYDETVNKSLSQHLEQKLADFYKNRKGKIRKNFEHQPDQPEMPDTPKADVSGI